LSCTPVATIWADGAEFDRLAGLPLRHLPRPRILERPAPHRPGDVGQHACLENLEHDVTSCFVATRCGSPAPDMVALEAMQALSRIGEPRATANVAIAARIAIGKKIEAGPSLIAEIGRHGISVLFSGRRYPSSPARTAAPAGCRQTNAAAAASL
jgi:hypothetical protein